MSNVYNFWDPAVRHQPQTLYNQVRAADPVHRAIGPVSGNPFWFLTRYEDCVTALKHPRIGKDVRANLEPAEYQSYMGEESGGDDPFQAINRHLLNMDPPDHTRLRALVHKAFTPRMVDNLRPRIRKIAADLLDAMAGHDEIDLIDAYALPLPIIVIAEMLGVPVEDQAQFRQWSDTLLFDPDFEASSAAAMAFTMYMQEMIERRQTEPQDDLITALVQAEEDGDKLDRMELMGMIFLLLVAGHETTVNLIGNGTLALLEYPDQMAYLQAHVDDEAVVKAAVEEILRYDGPVETATLRFAFEDIDFGGTVIPRGEAILVALVSANRDPVVFDAPDRFDISRQSNRHIAFGSGIHYCVGAPLARLEGQIAIPALVRRFPHLAAVKPRAEMQWNDSLLLHGMKAMPVRLG